MSGSRKRGSRPRAAAALAASAALLALAAAPGAAASDTRARAGRAVPFERAVTLADFGPSAYDPSLTSRRLRVLRRSYRVNGVTLLAIWMQAGPRSTRIRPGGETVRTANLARAIRSARRNGMRVTLRPYVDRDDGGWRGQLAPASVSAWFRSYRRFILRYASFAQRNRVHQLVVGSEMETLVRYSSRWRSLIRAVRRRFKGLIAYQSNWASYQDIRWWRSVDVVSISGYFPLTDEPLPTTARLVAGWRGYTYAGERRDWFAELRDFQRRVRRPVIFGEIGYRPVPGTAGRPFDTEITGPWTPSAQARAYEAALRVWYRVPWFRGFHWWRGSPYYTTAPRSKPDHGITAAAMKVIGRWYRRRR